MTSEGAVWFREQLPISFTHDARGVMGIRNNRPVAGVVYCHITPTSVEAHQVIADPMVLRNGWLEMLGQTAFGHTRRVVYSLIGEHNEKSLAFHRKLGFKDSGLIPEAFGEGIAGVVVSLLREDYPYLEESNG